MRYLSSAEFGLVRESTTERNWLTNHFPNQVRPLGFMLCAFEKSKDTTLTIKIGVKLYDILSNSFSRFKNYRTGRFFKADFVEEFEPAFTQNDPDLGKLKMAGFYYDTNIDDARLTLETIKDSLMIADGNSFAINYACVENYTRNTDGIIDGVVVRDMFTKKTLAVKGRAVTACGGIWTDEVMAKSAFTNMKIYPTKGVHVIVPNERLGNRNAFGIRSFDDGRFYFILRRGKVSVIGTTDTDYYKESKNLDEPWCTKKDCDYLLNSVNRLFPHARLTYKDVIGTYAGIRPLIKEEGVKSESAVSRNHEIFESSDGLVAIAGGKLTTFRLMAEELLFYLVKNGHLPAFSAPEHEKKGFSKISFAVGVTKNEFFEEVKKRKLDILVDPEQLEYIYLQFGRQGYSILGNIRKNPRLAAPLLEGYPHCEAEIMFILEHENAPRLIDILCRRTEAQWMIWHYKQKELAEKTAAIMARYYRWSPARTKSEIRDYLSYVKKTIWF
jgi:glycerol-3-phosphate dehydrogenase